MSDSVVFALKAMRTQLHYEHSNRQNRRAVSAVAATMRRHASRAFAKGMKDRPVVEGNRRDLWVGRRTAWLSQLELEQVNGRLHEIVKLMEKAARGRWRTKLYAQTFALSPFGTKRNP